MIRKNTYMLNYLFQYILCRLNTYNTSSVLRRPIVEGMLPVRLLLSRSLNTWKKSITAPASEQESTNLWVKVFSWSYTCIIFIRELKIWLGMLPESWFIPKWLRQNNVFTFLSNGSIVEAKDLRKREFKFGYCTLTSALRLSSYPTQDSSHQIQEALQWAYCLPDQSSITSRGCLVMQGWNRWTCWSSMICRHIHYAEHWFLLHVVNNLAPPKIRAVA